jgi:hypothetical protein
MRKLILPSAIITGGLRSEDMSYREQTLALLGNNLE